MGTGSQLALAQTAVPGGVLCCVALSHAMLHSAMDMGFALAGDGVLCHSYPRQRGQTDSTNLVKPRPKRESNRSQSPTVDVVLHFGSELGAGGRGRQLQRRDAPRHVHLACGFFWRE